MLSMLRSGSFPGQVEDGEDLTRHQLSLVNRSNSRMTVPMMSIFRTGDVRLNSSEAERRR